MSIPCYPLLTGTLESTAVLVLSEKSTLIPEPLTAMTPSSPNIRCSDHSTREREGAPSQRLQKFRLSPQMTSSDLGVHGALAVHDFRFGLTLTIPRCAGPTQSWLLAGYPIVLIRSTVRLWAGTEEAAVQQDKVVKKGLRAIEAATTDGSISGRPGEPGQLAWIHATDALY